MEVANMDFYVEQPFLSDFTEEYEKKLQKIHMCILEIQSLDDHILHMHWSGEGRDAFKNKITEWSDSCKNVKKMMRTAKEAVSRLNNDTNKLVNIVDSITILSSIKSAIIVDPYKKTMF